MTRPRTIVATLVITQPEEGEPQLTHSVTADGQPVNTGLVAMLAGDLTGVFYSGITSVERVRAVQSLAARVQQNAVDELFGLLLSSRQAAPPPAPEPEAQEELSPADAQ